jgi:hypothetical protein
MVNQYGALSYDSYCQLSLILGFLVKEIGKYQDSIWLTWMRGEPPLSSQLSFSPLKYKRTEAKLVLWSPMMSKIYDIEQDRFSQRIIMFQQFTLYEWKATAMMRTKREFREIWSTTLVERCNYVIC